MKLSKARYVTELQGQRNKLKEHLAHLDQSRTDDVRWLRLTGGPSGTGDRHFYVVDTGAMHDDRRMRIHKAMLDGVIAVIETEIHNIDLELVELGVEIDE
jgi:hypothetical protein